jgi:dephospho-CoA kinase
MQRDLCTEEEVKERMKTQWSDDQKIPLATYVFHNDGQSAIVATLETILLKINNQN